MTFWKELKARIGRFRYKPKKWRLVSLGTLCFTGILFSSMGEQNRTALAELLKDPLLIFAERSPGNRSPGAMTQTKRSLAGVRQRPGPFVPRERVLPQIRQRPSLPGTNFALPRDLAPIRVPSNLASLRAPSAPFGAVPPGVFLSNPAPGFLVTPGEPAGATPTQPGSDGGVTGPPTVRPVSPVPEAPQWLMLMLAFLMIGGVVRARRRRA